MRTRRALVALMCVSATAALAAEPSKDSSDAVERAREALMKKLEEANTDGVILMKGEKKKPEGERSEPAPRLDVPGPALATTLRDGLEKDADCLTLSGLATAAAAAADDPLGRIDRLSGAETDDGRAGLYWSGARLAETYLAIGFFDEAYALSSKAKGPRAAAISAIAAAAVDNAAAAPENMLAPERCGKLHALAAKIGSADSTGAANFTDADFDLVGDLPPPVAQAIFDRLSMAAIDNGEFEIAARIREARSGLTNEMRKSQAESFVEAALSTNERPDAGAAEALLSLSADPGPIRARALKQLVAANAATFLDESATSALYANLEDSRAASDEGGWEGALADALVDHKLKNGDWESALGLLARQLENHDDDDHESAALFSRILNEKLFSKDGDQSIAALAFIAENVEIAADRLNDGAFNQAAEELAQLGAADILEKLFSVRDTGGSMRDVHRSEARLRSGDVSGVKALVSGREGEADFLDIAAALFLEDQDAALPAFRAGAVSSPEAAATIARIAWAKGDWKTAAKYFQAANQSLDLDELREKAALAVLASGNSVGGNGIGKIANPTEENSGLAHMFASPPIAGAETPLREFSAGVSQEIAFIRKRIGK